MATYPRAATLSRSGRRETSPTAYGARCQFGMRERHHPNVLSAAIALRAEYRGSIRRPFQPAVRESQPTPLCPVDASDDDPTVGQEPDRAPIWRPCSRAAIPDRRRPAPKRCGVAIEVDDDCFRRAELLFVRTDPGSVG